jgi:chromosome segregation ATPase
MSVAVRKPCECPYIHMNITSLFRSEVLNISPLGRNLNRVQIRHFNNKLAGLDVQIATLKAQVDVIAGYLREHQSRVIAQNPLNEEIDTFVSYVRDHQSRLIAHERRFERAEGRIDSPEKEQILRDHHSRLVAHERRLELAEGRLDLLDKVLGPIVDSVRFLRRRWRTLPGR